MTSPGPGLTFEKYSADGAYHWGLTYLGGWRRSSPFAHARYDIALAALAARLDRRTASGLDTGCGDGVLLYKARRQGWRILGLDAELEGVRLASTQLSRLDQPATPIVCGSCEALPFAASSLDYVVSVEVIEHLEDVRRYLEEVARVLRPGGVFVLTTPNGEEHERPPDPYHVHEFGLGELATTLRAVFGDVVVFGQFPRILSRLYYGMTGMWAVDRFVTLVFKICYHLGWNPFACLVGQRRRWRWQGLVGVCRR